MKGLAKEHICLIHRHRQQGGGSQMEGEVGAEQRGAGWGGMGTSVIMSTVKIK